VSDAHPPYSSLITHHSSLAIWGLHGLPEIRDGDDLAAVIAAAVAAGPALAAGDVVVVTQKIVSKAEGRLVDLATVDPSPFARQFAAAHGKDPRHVEVVLCESRRIVKMDRGILITETHHGFICANAGVDASNVPGADVVCLLPVDPDASAERIRQGLAARLGLALAVVISDTFGRVWRVGQTNVAIGVAGLRPVQSYVGQRDPHGYDLRVTQLAVADEVAGAAELVMGKTVGVPAAVVRGLAAHLGPGTARDLLRPPDEDLFR
jgi:coenzyme F420-0:L-glutamate ligase/coenzyme F420-1:gamma-L-glutamate ligase